MNTHFDILLDASGSMGYMKGSGIEHENKYLLPDGSTRTDLAKKILINNIIPKLSFVNSLSISTFRNEFDLDKFGNRIIINNKYRERPIDKSFYNGNYDSEIINSLISKIENPEQGGTPLFWAISTTINQKEKNNFNIVVLSDGGASDREKFDEELLRRLNEINKKCKIYFIGIDQDEKAQIKSKNLAEKTNGFYVNINVINYDEKIFNSLLFDWNTKVNRNALIENLKIDEPDIVGNTKISIDDSISKINSAGINAKEEKEANQSNLSNQVAENSKSIKLINSQLDTILKEIDYLRKGNNREEQDFTTDEDETFNKIVGYKCEKHLNSIFLQNNWEKVTWLNKVSEQNEPYDFQITIDHTDYYIECKGSINSSNEFYLTKREWQFYLQNRKNYNLYFISEINSTVPKIIKIEDLLLSMEEGRLIPCSNVNRKLKADRILFQIIAT
jgi:hypothetical protein